MVMEEYSEACWDTMYNKFLYAAAALLLDYPDVQMPLRPLANMVANMRLYILPPMPMSDEWS